MSLNDKDITLAGPQGTDVYTGVANPAPFGNGNPYETNFVKNPTSSDTGAGAEPNFTGHIAAKKSMNAEAGVVEAQPGIIESSNIDPLDPNSNKDEEYANTKMNLGGGPTSNVSTGGIGAGTITDTVNTATGMATGAAKMAYGNVMGDQATLEAGKQEWSGANK